MHGENERGRNRRAVRRKDEEREERRKGRKDARKKRLKDGRAQSRRKKGTFTQIDGQREERKRLFGRNLSSYCAGIHTHEQTKNQSSQIGHLTSLLGFDLNGVGEWSVSPSVKGQDADGVSCHGDHI